MAKKKKAAKASLTGRTSRGPALQPVPIRTEAGRELHGGGTITGRFSTTKPNFVEVEIIDVQRVREAVELLKRVTDSYVASCGALPADGVFPQALISVARVAQTGEKYLKALCSAFTATVLNVREHKGAFEPGPLEVAFETEPGKRSPRWKDEATARAEEVAKLTGLEFDAETYQKRVLALTPCGADSVKPVIRERG